MKRRDVGILGEQLAKDFLKKRGYRLLESNYRCPEGEIDIIAKHKDCLVFIEVRTKRSLEFGSPEESITPTKMGKLRAVAAHYQQTHSNLPASWRIDVVAVELGKKDGPLRIELIENAVAEA
ncbi:MAG: YraN family protein [Dehalococcoidales bacterium]